MTNKRFLKLDKISIFAMLIGYGILLFHGTIRGLISQNILMSFNLPVYCAFLFFLPKSHGVASISRKFLKNRVSVWLLLALLLLISMLESGSIRINFVISLAIPVLIGCVELKEPEDINRIFSIWLKILNFVLLIVLIGGVLDIVSGYTVTKFFTELYHTEAILQMRIDEPSRIISFLGHPLMCSEFALLGCVFICIDMTYTRTLKHSMLWFACNFIVIALSGSKIAFLLALIIILIANIGNHRVRNILIFVIIGYILYSLGMLDVVIQRFAKGIKVGDLTSGRNIRLLELYSTGRLDFKWFSGHSQELSEHYIIALEYPLLRLSYRYGIFYTVCLFSVIFIRPIVILLKRKQMFLLAAFLLILVDVNTFSGLSSTGDGMLIFNVVIFLILNLSNSLYGNRTK